jgi:hypothetical protein
MLPTSKTLPRPSPKKIIHTGYRIIVFHSFEIKSTILERRVLALLTVSKHSDMFERKPFQYIGLAAPESDAQVVKKQQNS